MLRFAANLSFLFTEVPFRARFEAARMAGFTGVEYLFPYEHDPDELRADLDSQGLTQALFNLPPGDWQAGERGLAALPGRETDFDAALQEALRYAERLGCRLLHAMAGIPHASVSHDKAMTTYVDNLARGAQLAAEHDVTLVIEPINHRDIPGYFLSGAQTARRVIESVAADNLGLQLDLYHRQVSNGDLVHALRDYADITRHIQIANPPDRTQPGSGEIDYAYIFQAIEETGFRGWIGCEYRPQGTTQESLGWFKPFRKNAVTSS